jgi:hypothetical protein
LAEPSLHIAQSGEVVRVTSSAARGEGCQRVPAVQAEDAATVAANDVSPETFFVPVRVGPTGGEAARFARGRFRRDVTASLVWFPMDGGLRLAWHVELEPEGLPQYYDVLVDAANGELLRRNRARCERHRRSQSAATQALDPRCRIRCPSLAPALRSTTSC